MKRREPSTRITNEVADPVTEERVHVPTIEISTVNKVCTLDHSYSINNSPRSSPVK